MRRKGSGEDMKPFKGKDPAKFLESLRPEDRQVVEDIRRIVFEAVPGVKEVIKWGTLIYEKDKIIGGIMVHKNQVNLQLWQGSHLKDPEGLLEGTGQNMRHVKFVGTGDIRKGPLKELLRQAGKLA